MPEPESANPVPPDPGPPAPAGRGGASRCWDLLYGSLVAVGWPYLLWRRLVKRKRLAGWREKWGHVAARPAHPCRIWIHAVSVGEAGAARPLVAELRRQLPHAEVLVSTTTATGQEVARQRYGAENVFYYPYDFTGPVRRTLDAVRPALIVLMELEVWPNLTAEAARRGIPVVVVNGRVTERSARRYKQAWPLVGGGFRRVRRWLMQSEEYAARIRELGVEPARVEVAGNLKYDDLSTAPVSPEDRAAARGALGLPAAGRVLIGGSTHPTEEAALLAAYRQLRQQYLELRLVLVPRHPERLAAVEQEIAAACLPCVRRSAIKERGGAALAGLAAEARGEFVVLVDTLGELGRLYRGCDVAFIGGSLIPHGGQNVMEPAGLGLPTVFGPHMHNFAEAVTILRECQGAVCVPDAAALPDALGKLLAEPAAAQAMGARAREAFLKRQGAAKRAVEYLARLLPRVDRPILRS